jgi:hypothetical protein
MATPVRAKPGQVAAGQQPPSDGDNQGSYPAEITRDQFDWLHDRAAAHRQRWTEHAAALACKQKS